MRDHGTVPRRQHGGEHASGPPDRSVAHREGAAEKRVQGASGDPAAYGAVGQPQTTELLTRDDAVLAGGERSDHLALVSGAPFALHRYIRRTGTELAPRRGESPLKPCRASRSAVRCGGRDAA